MSDFSSTFLPSSAFSESLSSDATAGSSSGVGFAVPSEIAIRVVNDLLKYGKVQRGSMYQPHPFSVKV